MKMAVTAVMNIDNDIQTEREIDSTIVSAERNESSYVITGGRFKSRTPNETFYALIDGNKVPKDMPCPSESLVKGDGREYSIGAASILAKVTRDRLMHEYDSMYPRYNLRQHKGEYYGLSAISAVEHF
jgi:ribonuclease HII